MPLSIALMPIHTHHLGNMIAVYQVVNVDKTLATSLGGAKLLSVKENLIVTLAPKG